MTARILIKHKPCTNIYIKCNLEWTYKELIKKMQITLKLCQNGPMIYWNTKSYTSNERHMSKWMFKVSGPLSRVHCVHVIQLLLTSGCLVGKHDENF
jgi:hypothetical protein